MISLSINLIKINCFISIDVGSVWHNSTHIHDDVIQENKHEGGTERLKEFPLKSLLCHLCSPLDLLQFACWVSVPQRFIYKGLSSIVAVWGRCCGPLRGGIYWEILKSSEVPEGENGNLLSQCSLSIFWFWDVNVFSNTRSCPGMPHFPKALINAPTWSWTWTFRAMTQISLHHLFIKWQKAE
jgi:hypothetical protein